jgi:TetR/AcrR family transcriptional regulator, transcriptional repressor for nem operon
MKVTKEQAAATRARILDEAAKLFRERGFSGIGVADLMKGIGLTHGGFYGHFSSKEALMAEACQHAVSIMLEEWNRVADAAPAKPLAAVTVPYLSTRHRDRSGTGCLMAALGPEVSRQAAPVRHVVTECLGSVLEFLARLTPGKTAAVKHEKAIVTFASMVGALVISRAVNDSKVSKEILEVVSASVAGSAAARRR